MKTLVTNIANANMTAEQLTAYNNMQLPESFISAISLDEFRYTMAAELQNHPVDLKDAVEVLGTESVEFYVGDEHAALKIKFSNLAAYNNAMTKNCPEELDTSFSHDEENLTLWVKIYATDVQYVEIVRSLTVEHLKARTNEPEIKALFEAMV